MEKAGLAAHVPNEPWAHTLQLRDIQKNLPSLRVMGRVALGREAKLGCCSLHAPSVSVDTVIHFAAVETCLPRGFSFLLHILMAFKKKTFCLIKLPFSLIKNNSSLSYDDTT